MKNHLYKMLFDLIQLENRLYKMLFDLIQIEIVCITCFSISYTLTKWAYKMVFHVIIRPQRFNLVFDLMRYSYNKAIQYSYTYKPRLNVCLVGNRLTWMGVILSSYICFFVLFFFCCAVQGQELQSYLVNCSAFWN